MRTDFLFALLTGFLLNFAYPPFNLGFLAYWALVPFFFLLEEKPLRPAFRWGYLTGLFLTLTAVNELALNNAPSLLLTVLIHPFYYALYAVLHVFFRQKFARVFLFLPPFLWVGVEFLKSLNRFGFFGLNLGYTHPQYLLVLKIEPQWSSALLSFWVCSLNVLIYMMLKSLHDRRKIAYLLVATIAVLVIPLGCGWRSIEIPDVFEQMVALSKYLGGG